VFSGEVVFVIWLFILMLMTLKLFPNVKVLFMLGSKFWDTLIKGQIRVLNFDLFAMVDWPILGMIATFVVRGRRIVVHFNFMRLESTLIMTWLWQINNMFFFLLSDMFELFSNWFGVMVNNRLRLDAKMGVKSAHLSMLNILFWFFNAMVVALILFRLIMSLMVSMEVVLALGNSVAKVVSASFGVLIESVDFFGDVVFAIWRGLNRIVPLEG